MKDQRFYCKNCKEKVEGLAEYRWDNKIDDEVEVVICELCGRIITRYYGGIEIGKGKKL